MNCSQCNAPSIKCRGVCKSCYDKAWRREQHRKYGKKPQATYQPIDLNEFWLWIKNEVKLAEAQDRTHTPQP